MQAPKRVIIGPNMVPLEINSTWGSGGDLGECTMVPNPVIRLRSLETPWDYTTLLHECLHLISEFYFLDLSEAQVRALDQQITQLLMTNPKLVKGLLGTK